MRAGFWILFSSLTLLFAAVLELNHNTLVGWVLLVVLAAVFIIVFKTFLLERPWYLKLLSWILYAALFFGVLLLTWPPVKAVPASEDRNPASTAPVMTDKGFVSGVYTASGEVEVYAGIP